MQEFGAEVNNKRLWKFSEIPSIEESTFNKVLDKFYDMGISGLVRENIQNSLDGKLNNSNEPVVVNIQLGEIPQEIIPGIEEIKERINCLNGRNRYTKDTIKHMQLEKDKEVVKYISFEDSNTKGLKGAKNGQSDSSEDTWGIYAYNKGVHSEEKNVELEQGRGGSHGIGKIASNSASDLYLMYFSNCDEDGNKHLGGTVQLMEHKYGDKYYRATGYFTDIKNIDGNTTKFYPYENNFNNIFAKDTRGLKIVIPFLRESFYNEKEIIKSICDSFFVAILHNKLNVIVNNNTINSETIGSYIKNKEYYEQDYNEIKTDFTPLYLETYQNSPKLDLCITDKERVKYNFYLYFNYNELIQKGRVAIVRTIGMKIEDKKITSNVNKPFNAVLVPKGIAEDVFLKSLENESHTELSYKHIKNQREQDNAKRFINNISKEIAKIIDSELRRNNPTDGLMNTDDVLYITENQFKKDLKENSATVKVNNGKKEKTLIKVSSGKKKKSNTKANSESSKKVREIKPSNKDKATSSESKNYSIDSNAVRRIVLGNKEIIKLDFTNIKEFKDVDTCNLSMSVIDGMGNEYNNEFNLTNNYQRVIDRLNNRPCDIKRNQIINVGIKNGIVEIELNFNTQYNKSLKFIYYVEVKS